MFKDLMNAVRSEKTVKRKYFRKYKDGPWEEIDFQTYLRFWHSGKKDPMIVNDFSYISMPASLAA